MRKVLLEISQNSKETLKSPVSRYLITWTNLLHFSHEIIVIWQKNQVLETMPETFKITCSSHRCIIHSTKIFCQKPSWLFPQGSLYSSYNRQHVIYKGLLAIAPFEAKFFVSEFYAGCISRKEILRKSFMSSEHPWEANDSIIVIHRFPTEREFKPFNMKLNIPLFISAQNQLLKDEVMETQDEALLRIHVEKAITWIKKKHQTTFLSHFMGL